VNTLNSSSSSASFTVDKQEEEGQHVICKLANGFGDVTNVTVDEETAAEMDTCAELQSNENKYFVKTRNGGSVDLLMQFGSNTSSASSGYRTAANRQVDIKTDPSSSDGGTGGSDDGGDNNSSDGGESFAASMKLCDLVGVAASALAATLI
jgi:hypothetical protein